MGGKVVGFNHGKVVARWSKVGSIIVKSLQGSKVGSMMVKLVQSCLQGKVV